MVKVDLSHLLSIFETKIQSFKDPIISFSTQISRIQFNYLRINSSPNGYYCAENTEYVASGAVEIISGGEADRFGAINSGLEKIIQRVVQDPEIPNWVRTKIFGGLAFTSAQEEIWTDFNNYYFFLPQVIISQNDEETWITVNIEIGDYLQDELESQVYAIIKEITEISNSQKFSQPPIIIAESRIEKNYWNQLISNTVELIKKGGCDKVVLSRPLEIEFLTKPLIIPAISYLREHFPNAFLFYLSTTPESHLISASPELLVKKQSDLVKSMALAGSVGRSTDPIADENLGEWLLTDEKNLYEHKVVVDTIKSELRGFSGDLHVGEKPYLVKLKNIQHLRTDFKLATKGETNILDLVEALHPTPALGGFPRESAMNVIADTESISRGWYGGPVGFIDLNFDGEFIVAIRSAVIKGRSLLTYAGVGIIEDSNPESEWRETQLKFKPILDAFGINGEY